jgi:stress up-regulated protein Nod 19
VRQANARTRTVRSTDGIQFQAGLAAVVGVLAVGAGVLHLLAARDHLEHPLIAAFFVNLACAQIAWAALVVWQRSSLVLKAGIIGNLIVVGIWMMSRTTGIPLFEVTSEVEPIGFADAAATLFELTSAAGAGLLLILPVAALTARLTQARAQRLVAGTSAIAMLLVIPGFVTESHHHDHGDTEVLAAAHTHDGTGAEAIDGHMHTNGAADAAAEAAHTHPLTALSSEPQVHQHAPGHVHGVTGHIPDGSSVHSHTSPQSDGHQHASGQNHASGHGHENSATASEPAIAKPPGKVAEMLYGPFVLPAAEFGGQAHYNQILPAIAPPCVNCMVTAMIPDLVYVDGSSANLNTGPMLHHTVLFDPLKSDPTCGRSDGAVGFIGHRMFASGNERTAMIMPPGYAVKIDSPWWAGVFEIMNHATTQKAVFFKLTVRYLAMDDASVKPVTPIWLDVDNCGDSQFGVPKGESVTKWKWKSTMTGRIVAAGGHVHDGGISITLSNPTRGTRMCTSHASYGTKPQFMGAIERMSICPHDRIGVVKAGEYLEIDAYYNALRPAGDVMGIMMAYVYETNDLTGGSTPPAYYTAAPPNDAPPPQSHAGHGH